MTRRRATSASTVEDRHSEAAILKVARDLGQVRSYLLKGGKLFLSLMADGGIYEWHRQRD